MMRVFLRYATVAAVSMAAMVGQAEESKVQLDKLPKVVTEAIKKMFPTAELIEATEEKEGGEVEYEVTVKVAGKKIDITVEASGKIEGYEKEFGINELPPAVTAALDQAYPKATKKSAEAVYEIEDGKAELEYYEIQLVTADKKEIEAKLKADGTLIKDQDQEEPKKAEPAPKK